MTYWVSMKLNGNKGGKIFIGHLWLFVGLLGLYTSLLGLYNCLYEYD